jgi:hypothetical protein
MLLLDKHSDPSLSIIYISSIIIEGLTDNGSLLYDDLLAFVVNRVSHKAKSLFHYSLSFLFSINKIEYNKDEDCFRMVI